MSTPIIDEKSTFLHYCSRGNMQGVQEYLTNYKEVLDLADKGGWTGLHYVAHAHHTEVAQALLDAGAKTDILNGAGETALHIAVVKGYLDIVLALVRAGADLSIKDKQGLTVAELAPSDEIRAALSGFDPRAPAGSSYAVVEEEPDSE